MIRRVIFSVVAAAGLAAGLAVTAAPASAVPTGLPATSTVCGGGIGGGLVTAYYDPAGNFQGANPTVWVRPEFDFLPLNPSGYCGVQVQLRWRNIDKGTSGIFPNSGVPIGDNTAFGPNVNGAWVPLTPPTGKGRVEVTILTSMAHIPGTGSFLVA